MIAGTWLRLVRKDDGLDPSHDEAREERRVFVQDVRMPALTRSHVVGRVYQERVGGKGGCSLRLLLIAVEDVLAKGLLCGVCIDRCSKLVACRERDHDALL
jgi:hypothetical protein